MSWFAPSMKPDRKRAVARLVAKAKYTPISGFWAMLVPTVVGGVIYYAWNSNGYVAQRLQTMLRPIVDPVATFLDRVI